MTATFLQELLGRIGPGGVLTCACGAWHRIEAGEVLVESGALARAAELVRRRNRARPAIWVLSDERTEAAAGGRWKAEMGGAAILSRVLPATPRPVPGAELADELVAEVRRSRPDVLVAVGGGVISDLVKRVSLQVDLPNWCVATAPSVDAYSSATASIRVDGYHQSVPARASEVIVCDLDVLAGAPRVLLLAGLGDLLAKFVAYLDWNVARLVTGEPFCPTIAELSLASARRAVEAARALESDPRAAAASLVDALLVSGFAMQALGGSRSAASAEHTVAHFWETTHAARNRDLELHGILVGAATALVLPGYRAFYDWAAADVAHRRDAKAGQAWESRALEPGMQPFADKIAAETAGRQAVDGAVLAARLETFERERTSIAGLAAPLLDELTGAVELLDRLGFPFRLDDLGIPAALRMLPVRNVRRLRNRYTTFDLAHELGGEAQVLDAIAAASL
jgi:glycerol-1-phosphate dehydrogenase [NAD(P)+]